MLSKVYDNRYVGVEPGARGLATGLQPGQGRKNSLPANSHQITKRVHNLFEFEVKMSHFSTLLIFETPHQIIPSLAAEIGLNEAVFIQQLHYLLNSNECYAYDGFLWWRHTNAQWLEKMPYFSERTLIRVIASLKKQGLLVVDNLSWKVMKIRGDRTNWYRINYEKIKVLSDKIEAARQEKKMVRATKNSAVALENSRKCQNGSMATCQNGTMSKCQNGTMINKNDKEELLGGSKPADAGFDFDLVLMFVLNTLRQSGYNVDDVVEAAFIKSCLEEYQKSATNPVKSRALSHVQVALQTRYGVLLRSSKAAAARDKLNESTVNLITAQATEKDLKASAVAPKTTEQKLTDRSWAEGLDLDDWDE